MTYVLRKVIKIILSESKTCSFFPVTLLRGANNTSYIKKLARNIILEEFKENFKILAQWHKLLDFSALSVLLGK